MAPLPQEPFVAVSPAYALISLATLHYKFGLASRRLTLGAAIFHCKAAASDPASGRCRIASPMAVRQHAAHEQEAMPLIRRINHRHDALREAGRRRRS